MKISTMYHENKLSSVLLETSCYRDSLTTMNPAGKFSRILRRIPRDGGWWWRNPCEIRVVSETRIDAEIQGKFEITVEMRGKFPQTWIHINSPKNDFKSSLEYFHITGTLPMLSQERRKEISR